MDDVVALPLGGSFGVLSRPAQGGDTALVLLNAGLIHRVGPFRLHVHLARRLASSGMHAFRLDLPFVGDGAASDAPPTRIVSAAIDEVRRRTGSRKLLLGGICSGADLAWKVAVEDPRVDGVVLIDGFARRDAWFRIGQLQLALRRPATTWPGMIAKALLSTRPGQPRARTVRDWPEPDAFQQQAKALLERGARILALYTGGVAPYLLHARQFDSTFGGMRRHTRLEIEYWPGFDHILFSSLERAQVVERMTQWAAAAASRGDH